MEYSEREFKALIAAPMISGSITFLSCGALIASTLFYSKIKLRCAIRRIIFGHCVYIMITAFSDILSVFVVPKGEAPYARGNIATCNMQGFMRVLGHLGACSYLGALSFYYVAVIKFNLKDTDFVSRKYEAACHIVSNIFPFVACFTLLSTKSFNRIVATCRIGPHPIECTNDPGIECERGANFFRYFQAFVSIPLILIIIILVVNMSLVIATVITRKRKADKWRLRENGTNSSHCCGLFANRKKDLINTTYLQDQSKSITGRNGTRDIESQSFEPRRKSVSRSGNCNDPLAFDARRVRQMIREETSMAKSEPIILSSSSLKFSGEEVVSSRASLRRSSVASNKDSVRSQESNNEQEDEVKATTKQCLLLLSTFLICYLFPFITLRAYSSAPTYDNVPVLLFIPITSLMPLQGFFLIMVYSRPHVKSLRQRNPEYSWIKAFLIVFKAGGDNDTAGGQNQEYTVIDETGIDAPRLPEAERLRRQELVRKDYMQRRGTMPTAYKVKETLDTSQREEEKKEVLEVRSMTSLRSQRSQRIVTFMNDINLPKKPENIVENEFNKKRCTSMTALDKLGKEEMEARLKYREGCEEEQHDSEIKSDIDDSIDIDSSYKSFPLGSIHDEIDTHKQASAIGDESFVHTQDSNHNITDARLEDEVSMKNENDDNARSE
ncbi:hypothetical protein CTEN210_06783 [Chaetoceros tenuissimus]|uniref:Uncharacterized protein n=1 Tax=Chaetoceros tenuissimus TaxID=426638 RepID=A0AAD3CQI0_9STRA|nr:hypothetical protein CTEN210_06783 [Chaetoceros tenuissimus]